MPLLEERLDRVSVECVLEYREFINPAIKIPNR
jgi:hypothetical protein